MTRVLVALAALALATPAFADTPDKGSFGLGATLGGTIGAAGYNSLTFTNGLTASYFATRELNIGANLGIGTTENVGTVFNITAGVNYYFMRDKQLSPFVGGAAGIGVVAPSGGTSSVVGIFQAGGGFEYFVSRNFGIRITESLGLVTKPVSFALITQLGFNLYL